MNVSNRDSRGHEDDTDLDIDAIKDSIHLELEAIDLVLEPEPQGQDGYDKDGDIFPELVYIEEDDSCTSFTFNSIRDYPSN